MPQPTAVQLLPPAITIARDRFMPGVGFANRAYGLQLYYAAQFLFAFSIGH